MFQVLIDTAIAHKVEALELNIPMLSAPFEIKFIGDPDTIPTGVMKVAMCSDSIPFGYGDAEQIDGKTYRAKITPYLKLEVVKGLLAESDSKKAELYVYLNDGRIISRDFKVVSIF